MLRLENVVKTFNGSMAGQAPALSNINLELREGDFATVIGSNGAGKTTLLNAIAGVFPLDRGTICIDGKRVDYLPEHLRAPYIGRVFQNPLAGTAPNMTIEENMAMALARGRPRGLRMAVTRERREFFKSQLRFLQLGLEDRLNMKAALLSGGERQALTLLMATITKPKILLLDEHTASLDPKTAELVSDMTESIIKRDSLTSLMVTHNMEQALRMGNRLIMLDRGELILDIPEHMKKRMSVDDLLNEFEKVKHRRLVADDLLLGGLRQSFQAG